MRAIDPTSPYFIDFPGRVRALQADDERLLVRWIAAQQGHRRRRQEHREQQRRDAEPAGEPVAPRRVKGGGEEDQPHRAGEDREHLLPLALEVVPDRGGEHVDVHGLRVYLHRRVGAMLFLGFSAGLPFPLVFATLSAWLSTAGVSKASIGMFAWVGITYSAKFLWAPLVDRLALPGLTAWLGRRRSWMLLAQLGVVTALVGLSGAEPASNLAGVALLSLGVAFASATQDIAVDAWRIESVEARVQGAMAASYQFGYRLAMLASGAGALTIADLVSWPAAYKAMAMLMMIGVITVLLTFFLEFL